MASAIGSWRQTKAGVVALLACLMVCRPALAEEPQHSAELDAMIVKEAQRHGVPERLVRRIVMRESRYNPRARNHKYWGLMQISYPTARSMGFKGTPEELLNPLVNLTYAVPYLANAFIAAGKREDAAVRLYARGYYDTARHLGMLGALRTADSAPVAGFHDDVQVAAAAPPEPSFGIFGALIGPSDPAPAAPSMAAAPFPAAVASAPPAAPQGPAIAASAPQGKGDGNVEMVADKTGHVEPPKKWLRDGGVSVLARGEQGLEHVAAYATPQGKPASRHSHKSTQFASLDAPPSAQAYAASDGTPAAPQAAISQVVSAPAASGVDPATAAQAVYAPAPPAAQLAAASAAPPAPAEAASDVDHPASKKRRKAAQKHHAVASAEANPIEANPAEAVAALRP